MLRISAKTGMGSARPEAISTSAMPPRRDVPGWAECAFTTTAPPATEKASGKLLAPNTATGPTPTMRSRRSGRGSGSPLPPESRRASRARLAIKIERGPGEGAGPLHLGPASALEGGLNLVARCRIDGPERGLAPADRGTTDQHLPGDGHDLSPLNQPSVKELSAPRRAARSESPDHLAHRSTSGSSLRAISRRPARVAG
jgi:hypothetical protein